MDSLRVGHGFDVHRLVAGQRLVIGGVTIPHGMGLEGHSDADVLLHAIADAILGAVGLPDIGQQFPPDDDRYLDADSSSLLARVLEMARESGLRSIVNVDCVILAEQPRINPHVAVMKSRIAAILEIDQSRVGIKASTCEKLGFVGREEGMAASATCLIITNG
jgi:2-C-methyl-D-erythritol 2,4-cyclodiphosphate synthase